MFDYIFLRIINAESVLMVDACDYAINTVETLTETQKLQLHILCGMQKAIMLQKEVIGLMEEANASDKEIADALRKCAIKVMVEPIPKEE